jgi:hypothetical protein
MFPLFSWVCKTTLKEKYIKEGRGKLYELRPALSLSLTEKLHVQWAPFT